MHFEFQTINHSRILAGSDCPEHVLEVPQVPAIHSEYIYYSNQHQYCVEKDSEFG